MNSLSDKSSLSDIQKHLGDFCLEKGWDKNSVAEVFLLFSEEVGELAKEIRIHTGFKGEKAPENKDNMTEEFADVFNYLLELANRFDINLEEAYKKKHLKNATRIWHS